MLIVLCKKQCVSMVTNNGSQVGGQMTSQQICHLIQIFSKTPWCVFKNTCEDRPSHRKQLISVWREGLESETETSSIKANCILNMTRSTYIKSRLKITKQNTLLEVCYLSSISKPGWTLFYIKMMLLDLAACFSSDSGQCFRLDWHFY